MYYQTIHFSRINLVTGQDDSTHHQFENGENSVVHAMSVLEPQDPHKIDNMATKH